MTLEESTRKINERLLREAGYNDKQITVILDKLDKGEIKSTMSPEKLVDTVLNADEFWDYLSEQDTDGNFSLEAILRRNGTYSEEKLREAKLLSNKNRIAAGRKPLFPNVI